MSDEINPAMHALGYGQSLSRRVPEGEAPGEPAASELPRCTTCGKTEAESTGICSNGFHVRQENLLIHIDRLESENARLTRDLEAVVEAYNKEIHEGETDNLEILRLRSEVARLTRERDDAYKSAQRSAQQVADWENREATVCPEDFSFEEVVASHHKRTQEAVAILTSIAKECPRRLEQPAMCGVCLGAPLPSGKECICKGEGTEEAEMRGLRLMVYDLEAEISRLEADREGMAGLLTTVNALAEDADEVIRHINASYTVIPDTPLAHKLTALCKTVEAVEAALQAQWDAPQHQWPCEHADGGAGACEESNCPAARAAEGER